MNAGMVIKRNANQKYATSGPTGIIMREIARRSNLPPLQEFMVRQDCGCGSTIGPLISSTTGIRAVDVGCPSLSMHSIRETMGVCDCKYNCITPSGKLMRSLQKQLHNKHIHKL